MDDNSRLLSFEDILDVDDVQYAVIEVPEWHGSVRIGSLSAGDLIDFVEANENPLLQKTAGLRLLSKSLVDEKGKRIGDDEKIRQLQKKDARIVSKIVAEILKLNGMDKKTADAEKNGSGEARTGASLTSLPSQQIM
jgi:hypothetical protein